MRRLSMLLVVVVALIAVPAVYVAFSRTCDEQRVRPAARSLERRFVPDPGTQQTQGQLPLLTRQLDALGKALGVTIYGISGYRTPAHNVAVGGFADDPHTLGEASDTPGVEGVPEATLERFCLTRPFPGPREADHIQEL